MSNDLKNIRDLLASASGGAIEATRLQTLGSAADATANELTRLADSAPDDVSRTRTTTAASALRGYVLAIEDEQLLRDQTPPASEDARADANQARRFHGQALDEAVSQLDGIAPNKPDAPRPTV